MKISVFTPIHRFDKESLLELKSSLLIQGSDFEWIVLLNGAAKDSIAEISDLIGNIATIHTTDITKNVGALKSKCCELATGEILLEVDYDDYLDEDAFYEVRKAFKNKDTQFVYSNCAEFKEDGSSNVYSSYYGWQTEEAPSRGLTSMVAFPEQAHYMRRIEWAPNHLRAFRKSAYEKVDGYDVNLIVGDDHDLVCRFYLEYGESGFKHINKTLYYYRVHSNNTCNASNLNANVQEQVELNVIKYNEDMFKKWAEDNNLLKLDLGGRFNCPVGYQSVDLQDANIIMDLNGSWNLPDNSVGVLRAYHVLEHLDDAIHFFNEAYRVLVDGGIILMEVPSAESKAGFADPTHKLFFNTLSFEYYTNEYKAKYIRPKYKGAFQKARLVEYAWNNDEKVISAQLIALKGGWYENRWCGEKLTGSNFIK